MKLFHGTTKSRANDIEKEGIIPGNYEVLIDAWMDAKDNPWPVEKFFDFDSDHKEFSDLENQVHNILKTHRDMIGKTSLTTWRMVAEAYATQASNDRFGTIEYKIAKLILQDCPGLFDVIRDDPPAVVECELSLDTEECVILVDRVEPENIKKIIDWDEQNAVET